MLETSLGRPAFLAGLRAFLERHRGGAATCEDLLAAMAGAAGGSQEAAAAAGLMQRWYDQAGTPEVEVAGEWNPNARTYTLRLSQRTEPTPGEPRKQPVPIPVAVGLLGRGSGRQLPLRLASGTLAPVSMAAAAAAPSSLVLLLTAPKQTWVFNGVDEEPVLSLLRGCSAPVGDWLVGACSMGCGPAADRLPAPAFGMLHLAAGAPCCCHIHCVPSTALLPTCPHTHRSR